MQIKSKGRVLATLIIAFAISFSVSHASGCGSCTTAKASANSTELNKNGNVWATLNGEEYFTCPVMKSEMKVADATSFSVVDGEKFYHCCPGCEKPFQSNPVSFLKEINLPANVTKIDTDGNKHFRDPVSGVEMEVSDQTVFVDRDNSRYFFSSAKTMDTFEKSPDRFLGKLGS
ncbi:MAG: hypothetical protein HOK84_17830 [Bacteroidetes bacterium]|nr:hypothetical protein [Bacteroidota bacterium]